MFHRLTYLKVQEVKGLLIKVLSVSTLCCISTGSTQAADVGPLHEFNEDQCSKAISPLVRGTKPTLINKAFKFLEGPTWSKQSKVFYFSEMDFNRSVGFGPESVIYKLTLPSQIEVVLQNAGTNGLLAEDNNLYTMNHASRSLSKLNLTSLESKVLSNSVDNLRFNSPNDLIKADNGVIYFTDPDWQLDNRQQDIPYTGLYGYLPTGKTLVLDKTLIKPNGVALSPDQQFLYVGDFTNRIYKYKITPNGELQDKHWFADINSPDGMAMDCAGNLYVASHNKGVINIYANDGKLRDKITIGHNVTNIAFGGDQGKTLLITSAEGLYRFEVNIAGLD